MIDTYEIGEILNWIEMLENYFSAYDTLEDAPSMREFCDYERAWEE